MIHILNNLISDWIWDKLEVVSKVPLYGYFPDPKPFVKVYLRHPADVANVALILEVSSRRPYLCQIDYVTYSNVDTTCARSISINIYSYSHDYWRATVLLPDIGVLILIFPSHFYSLFLDWVLILVVFRRRCWGAECRPTRPISRTSYSSCKTITSSAWDSCASVELRWACEGVKDTMSCPWPCPPLSGPLHFQKRALPYYLSSHQ